MDAAFPVLFLDIDGVLNCREFFMRRRADDPDGPIHGVHALCRDRVALLNEVIARSKCLVTVSSVWRRDRNCRNLLRRAGFRGSFSRDWRTDWLQSIHQPDLVRGDEIAAWLRRNKWSRYAIVDDDSDMLEDQFGRFVQTDNDTGLTQAHADRLVGLLEASS